MRFQRAALAVLSGHRPFEATEELRHTVGLLVFNGTPEARIAAGLGLTIDELRYYFADELGYSQDRLLARCTADMIELARQRQDLGVAFRANALMLQTRLKAWREPKPEDPVEPALDRVESLTLDEVERELARLQAGAADPGPPPAAPEGEPA